MLWKGRRESSNVEDARGSGGKIIGGGIGAIVIAVIIYFLGGDPSAVLQQGATQAVPQTEQQKAAEDEAAHFVSVVLAETEDVWHRLFNDMGKEYREPKLRLFTQYTESGCGSAGVSAGPFYCSEDEKVYIDLSFYDELKTRFHSPGDFAMAYVVAHEVGHHVQNLLGITDKVNRLRSQSSKEEANRLSVMLELQADFLAGVWAHHDQKMKKILEAGDIDEALNAANAIGDDRLQMQSQGYVVPDAFTHGTSEQRMYWFKKGYETGDISQGDTFNSNEL